ncbi:MAG: BrnA antitoxin family protein [Alphaproteobacteria bacterium]
MSGRKRVLGSDLARVDAHTIQPAEYEEIPELTDEFFVRADEHRGGRLVRRGRPPKESPKISTTIRLDREVLEYFRSTGPGWQSRMNDVLRRASGL